jgi:tetratricopeptide (TPR) repeat protein
MRQPSAVASSGRPQAEADPFALAAARLDEKRPLHNRQLQKIAALLKAGHLEHAREDAAAYLLGYPEDADGLFLAAEALARLGRRRDAAPLFARCLERAPDFTAARFGYARLLLRLNRFDAALSEAGRLFLEDASNPLFLQLKANALLATGEDKQALAIWEALAAAHPARAESWIKYGDGLRASGFPEQAVAAYRQAVACATSPGLAWWSLANLKTFRFDEHDIAAMQDQVMRSDLAPDDRINLLFALGKAYEDRRDYKSSFEQYAKANAAKRLRTDRYPPVPKLNVAENRTLFAPPFFPGKSNVGCPVVDPVFVLGQQRSGSTLVEQILCSHPAIEGAGELKYIPALARTLEEEHGTEYPRVLEKLDAADLSRLGRQYMDDARLHRRSGRPFFVDKNPGNYHHVGLICLILPKAKIIDVRRHPAACCLSIFKQNLGTASLRLNELARNYRDYVALLAHFDRVLPRRVHRVIYEELVRNPEAEIRRMLDFLELPFEESCLRFYESGRTVITPSSEQVRRPISADAIDDWRNFEPWLKPLLDSLGTVASAYPAVPEELIWKT